MCEKSFLNYKMIIWMWGMTFFMRLGISLDLFGTSWVAFTPGPFEAEPEPEPETHRGICCSFSSVKQIPSVSDKQRPVLEPESVLNYILGPLLWLTDAIRYPGKQLGLSQCLIKEVGWGLLCGPLWTTWPYPGDGQLLDIVAWIPSIHRFSHILIIY